MSKQQSNSHSPPTPSSFAGSILQTMLKVSAEMLDARSKRTKYGNKDALLAEMFLWDEIASYAKKYADSLWDQAKADGVYSTEGLDAGQHTLVEDRSFYMALTLTKPIKRLDEQALIMALKASKFKVPEPIAKMFIENAKLPTKGQERLKIVER